MPRFGVDAGANPFDKPLSSRFDEQDAFCIFDDVLVPWGRIFIDGDVEVHNAMRQTSYAISMTAQSTTRALTKLEFAYGLARHMAKMIGDYSPATTEMLGEMACWVRMTADALELSLEQAREPGDGVWFPNGVALEPMRAMLAVWMPRVAEIIILIGSHNLLTTPNRAQLDDPQLRPLIDEMLSGADGALAEVRAAVFRLAWDFVGSSLGGRGFLYERFYLTSTARSKQMLHSRFFDRTRSQALLNDTLSQSRTVSDNTASAALRESSIRSNLLCRSRTGDPSPGRRGSALPCGRRLVAAGVRRENTTNPAGGEPHPTRLTMKNALRFVVRLGFAQPLPANNKGSWVIDDRTPVPTSLFPNSLRGHDLGQRATGRLDDGDHDTDWSGNPAQAGLFHLQEATCLQS